MATLEKFNANVTEYVRSDKITYSDSYRYEEAMVEEGVRQTPGLQSLDHIMMTVLFFSTDQSCCFGLLFSRYYQWQFDAQCLMAWSCWIETLQSNTSTVTVEILHILFSLMNFTFEIPLEPLSLMNLSWVYTNDQCFLIHDCFDAVELMCECVSFSCQWNSSHLCANYEANLSGRAED